MSKLTENKPKDKELVTLPGSAAFQSQYFLRDTAAGVITGAMAIPLTIGIAIMSDYPIKVGLATVAFACLIGWINAWLRPGNFIGAPGIAAGLAPVLAMGVATFGWENIETEKRQNLAKLQVLYLGARFPFPLFWT